MIPANYLSPAQATTILNALRKGTGTSPDSTGTASDLGYNGFNVVPSLLGLPTDLVNRVITTDMASTTAVFSTSGLATASITMLNEIRNRVVEAVGALYDDQNTPIQSPFYGLTVGSAEYNHMRDAIIHMIFRFDSRYLLRKRSDVGNGAENSEYELPSRYQFTNYPLILGRMRRHGFDNVNEIDDDGTNGAYQIKTSTPHGYYTGMTVATDGTNPGATTTQEILGLDHIYQTSGAAIGDVTSKFVLDTGSVNHFIDGQRVIAHDPTGITILDWQPDRYVKRLSDTEFQFYRDAALTSQIVPGWGNVVNIHTANVGAANETLAVSTNGTHIILEDVPFVFDRTIDSNNDLSIFEQKFGITVDPLTGIWSTTTGAGFSIVDGQPTNFAGMNSDGWQNIHSFETPLYFKKLTDTTFELYYDTALTSKFYPGTDIADTVSSFVLSGGIWSVNFSSNYPPIISGQSVSFRNTDTDFSNALGISTFTPIQTTTPNLDYNVVEYAAGQFIAAGADSAGSATGNYYYSADGIKWTLGSWTGPVKIRDIAYNATNNRTVALEEDSTYVQYRTGTGSWAQANKGSNTSAQRIVTFNYNGTPRFFVMPQNTSSAWQYSETGAAGSWSYYTPFGVSYGTYDIAVGGSSGSDLVVVGYNSFSGHVVSSKSTNGGQTFSAWTLVHDISTIVGLDVNVVYNSASSKYFMLVQEASASYGYYSSNGTSWTSVTLPAGKVWHNLRDLNGVLYANANDGSTSSIKSTDGGVTWSTVTLTHGGIEISTYFNGRFVGVKNPTSTPAFVHSLDAESWANYDDSTWTLSANHSLENGQPIRFNAGSGSSFDIAGYTCVVPRAVWAKTTGLAANEFKLYLDEGLTLPWTPWYGATIGAKSLTGIFYRMAFYAKRTDADTFGLYVDSAMTNPYNQTVSLTGFTTGDLVRTGHTSSMTAPVAGYFQPAFYATTESYTSFKLWADAAHTVPYPYYQKNGGLTTSGLSGVTSNPDTSDNQGDIGLTAYTSYTTGGAYRLYNVGYVQAFTSNQKALSGSVKPVYYVNKITDTVLELYVDSALTNAVRSGGGSPNAPAIGTPATSGGFDVTYYDEYQYRLDTIDCYNVGGGRYFYTDYNDGGAVKVNAQWTSSSYYTDHVTSQDIGNVPTVTVYEYANTNADTYYGMLRKTKASGANTNTGPVTVDPAVVGGVGSPVVFNLNDPGQFRYDSQIVFGIGAQANVGTAPAADPLDYVGAQWDTDSNLDSVNDRAWPTTVEPQSITWTIEQPNQTFESHNLNRYGRARDVTQYRFRLIYAPMTKDQFRPFLSVIHAARGSFKPFKFTPPKNFQGNSVTIDIYKRNLTVPGVVRIRDTVLGGQQVITLDGLPPNLTAAYSAGHAVGLEANGLGGWGIATHDVKTNSYGEANIRINNPIPVTSTLGDAVFSDAPPLDCYLDGNSVEIKVDTLGYHYLEVDLVTKRIF